MTLVCLIAAAFAAVQVQPVANGDFERGDAGWRRAVWRGQPVVQIVPEGRNGGRAAKVVGNQPTDGGWQTNLPVKPFSRYRLEAWIKTENVAAGTGRGALLNLHSRPEHSNAVVGTRDWTQVAIEFDSGADDTVQLNCILGFHGTSTGTAWYDDITLRLMSTTTPDYRATIHADRRREPMSPYIYSQFIEHLGRCIYGGIWAEMLEDRKFYHPLGHRDSPWQATSATVTMDTKNPFVGDHSPHVAPQGQGGIRQEGLHLVAGKRYVGRAWLAGPAKVQASLGDQSQTLDLGSGYAKFEFAFQASSSSTNAALALTSDKPFRVGTVSLMPADNVDGMRADTLELLKQLNAPLYRWPGGNFVSGYEWRDGLGDPDRRPPRKNPAWLGVEHNDFGVHEFMRFCELVGTEPHIVVNAGFGDSYSAAQWVEYMNGPADSTMGQWRAKNGRKEPWKVVWWGIGNEMYGDWQLGHMALNQYVIKHNDFAKRMRQVDPDIKIIAVGDAPTWSDGMLRQGAHAMTLLSEHFYCQEKPGVASHVAQIPDAIRRKAEWHRAFRAQHPEIAKLDIKVAMDEWNYWYGPHVFGELGTRYFLKDGLGIAAGVHEFARSTDVIGMAQYAQTVNVIGAIKTTPTAAAFETTGLVLMMYRKWFGDVPVEVSGDTRPVDLAAAWADGGNAFTIAAVNPLGEAQEVRLDLSGVNLADMGTRWRMADADPMAYNDPGSPPKIVIREQGDRAPSGKLVLPPYSVTIWKFPVKK